MLVSKAQMADPVSWMHLLSISQYGADHLLLVWFVGVLADNIFHMHATLMVMAWCSCRCSRGAGRC